MSSPGGGRSGARTRDLEAHASAGGRFVRCPSPLCRAENRDDEPHCTRCGWLLADLMASSGTPDPIVAAADVVLPPTRRWPGLRGIGVVVFVGSLGTGLALSPVLGAAAEGRELLLAVVQVVSLGVVAGAVLVLLGLVARTWSGLFLGALGSGAGGVVWLLLLGLTLEREGMAWLLGPGLGLLLATLLLAGYAFVVGIRRLLQGEGSPRP